MRYLLDTNAWVDYLNQRHPQVIRRIQSASPGDLALSSIVLAELRFGADKSRHAGRNHARIDILEAEVPRLSFDAAAARESGRLRAALEAQGQPIGAYDMLIAGQALSQDLILVTDNLREFSRVAGLRIENWRDEG